jgi:outer membrane protein OmpA-like peptidoglycan-associated protein/Mg-chelatase subunit ChlD
MSFSKFVILVILLSSSLISGCASLMYGEPAATLDAVPPLGYNPIFIKKTAQLPNELPQNTKVELTRIDATNPKKVSLYAHITDANGTYYYGGANSDKSKKIFCEIVEQSDDGNNVIKKFNVREVTENDREPVAIALVMDHSGSMGDPRARAVQEAAEQFIKLKKTEDAICFVKYDNHVVVEGPLSYDQNTLISQLKKNGLEDFGGGTAVHDGISGAVEHLNLKAQSFKRKVVIVFTDGQENSSDINKDSLIKYALKSNTLICAVDFGDGIREGYMESISKPSGGSYNHIYGTKEFPDVFEDIYKRIKNYYVVDYTPNSYGKKTVKLKLCFPSISITGENNYDNTPNVGDIALLNVFFDYDKDVLKPESNQALDNVYVLMRAFPKMKIEVRGHTDNSNKTGDSQYNQKLSQRRADAVKQAVVSKGVNVNRIKSIGFGDSQPIADNNSDDGKSQNRRTEFLIISK